MAATVNFIHLHTHTEFSFLDGAIRIKDMVHRAKSWGMPALAITDHGGMFGAVEFYDTCMDAGIKPVLGFEAYVAPRSRLEKSSGRDEKNYNHLVLLARNEEGWKNLMRLSTIGYLEGFYYRPRIDMEVLAQHSKGLVGTSACVAGAIPRAILAGKRDEAKAIAEQYLSIFEDGNFYFEIQNHNIDDEIIAFNEMIQLGKELGVPFIVTNDAHYLDKEDAQSHEVLLCLQTQNTLSNPNRYRFSSDEVYFKSPDEMAKLFPDMPDVLTNTVEIAEKCSVSIKAKPQLPVPDVPKGFKTPADYLRNLAHEGLKKKYPDVTNELEERLEYELDIITSMGFSGYFLIVRDFILSARKEGLLVNTRGSASGSIVGHVIDISTIDPIRFDLLFERFLNPERISMPDIDVDFPDEDRYKIIDYVVDKYGRDSVCQIINYGRMKAKMAIRDVARVMEIPISEADALSKEIPLGKKLDEAIQENAELGRKIQNNPRYQELVKHAKALEGLARQAGMHAGGVIIAPGDVVNWSPLFKQKSADSVMTQFDMNYVEKVGLIKMDFLGLRTYTLLQEAVRLVEAYHGEKINVWQIEDGDEKTYELFGRGDTTGVFQFESQGMQDYLRKLKPNCLEDLIAMAALYRPGPMQNIDSFIRRKHGKEEISYPHEMLRNILDVTYGVIVYQEQVMRIAQQMGGFSLGQADVLRKAMGKKKAEVMEEMGREFIDGAAKKGIPKKAAQEVYDLMAKFAQYGFCKGHATAYAHVSYYGAYLKAHYPIEYMTANLTSWLGNQDQFLVMKNEAERMGVKILPPDINSSNYKCSIDNGHIRLGLAAIKNVGKGASSILAERRKKGSFSSIFDLCSVVDLRLVNKKCLESLVCAGALDSLPGTRAQLFAAIDQALDYGGGFQKDRIRGQTDLFSSDNGDDNDSAGFTIPEPALPDVGPWPYNELLANEKNVLNFYVSGHPLDNYRDEITCFSTLKHDAESLQRAKDSSVVTTGGTITSMRTHVQRDGRPMAFIELEDFDGTIELIAFGDAYEQYRHLLAADAMILVKGTVMKEDERAAKIRVEKVVSLSETRELLTRSVHVRIRTQGLEEDFVRDVYDECSKSSGKCGLIIHLYTHEENEFKVRSKKITVSPARDVIERLRSKVGRENVWLSRAAA